MTHKCSKCPKPATVIINDVLYCTKCGAAAQRAEAVARAADKAPKP